MARRAKQQELRPNVNPDDVAACYAEYAGLRGDQARLNQRIVATLGRYEKQGVDPKAIKHAYTVAQKDPREAEAQFRRNAEYLSMLEIVRFDESGQGDFTAGLTVSAVAKPSNDASEKVRAARAHADGYNSALHGAKLDSNPFDHAPGSEEFGAWRSGWEDGAADRLAKNPDATKVTQAEPRRRGRPRKSVADDIGAPAGTA